MRRYSEVFKALSDETRLQMLGLLLCNDELCVCDFVEVMKITQSKASRHLRLLRSAGLLDDRRDGTRVYYHMDRRPVETVKKILEPLSEILKSICSKTLEKNMGRWLLKKSAYGNSCSNASK